jgi:hypothetical protein
LIRHFQNFSPFAAPILYNNQFSVIVFFMSEEIFHMGETGVEIIIDPASLNLKALPVILAAAGWAAGIEYPEEAGGDVGISLMDMGGAGGKTAAEIAHSLGIIDNETGEVLPGYTVSEESEVVQVQYRGVANAQLSEFVKAVHELSPFRP